MRGDRAGGAHPAGEAARGRVVALRVPLHRHRLLSTAPSGARPIAPSAPQLTATGVEVLPEMVIEVLRARRRIIEIPVNYRNPDIEQAHVRSPYQTPAMFRRMLGLIARKRVADTRARRGDCGGRVQPASCVDARGAALQAAGAGMAGPAWAPRCSTCRTTGRAPGGVRAASSSDCSRCSTTRRRGRSSRWAAARGTCWRGCARARPQRRGLLLGATCRAPWRACRRQAWPAGMADGEFLPLRTGQRRGRAVRRVAPPPDRLRRPRCAKRRGWCKPGGLLVVFEPMTSWFSQADAPPARSDRVPALRRLRVADRHPLQEATFREAVVAAVLREQSMSLDEIAHTDFLAYPLTGCYAGSVFAKDRQLMQRLLASEERIAAYARGRRGSAGPWPGGSPWSA